MTDPKVPPHLKRARFARRTQIAIAIAAAVFTLYRLSAIFRGRALR